MSPQDSYADKIAKLLRKAESTNSPAEAESLVAKAQELMIKYAIDEAMLRQHEHRPSETIIEDPILYHSVYSRALYFVGRAIAVHNDCKVLISKGSSLMKTTLHVIGHESDVRRVRMLNSSVQIQAMAALNTFWTDYDGSWLTEREKFKVRRQFLFSFAAGLNDKLEVARQAGLKTAAVEYGTDSVALVIQDKATKVELWLEQAYPDTRKVRSSFASGGAEAASAGRAAGRKANVGEPVLQGNRRELTS